MGYNNTSYKNEKGKEIPANANVKYRKNYFGFMVPSSSEAATDTIVTLTPDAPGATSQRIHLTGSKSKSERLDNTGTWVPSEFQNYWIPKGREAVQNMGNQPSYWNLFLNKVGFKQQGGEMLLQNMQKQIIALVQAAMKGDQKATQTVNQIMEAAKAGDLQAVLLAQMIQQTAQQLQGLAASAKLGAKLKYVKSLKFARGGKTCPACSKEASTKQIKKVEEKACGGKAKKMKKRYFGGWL